MSKEEFSIDVANELSDASEELMKSIKSYLGVLVIIQDTKRFKEFISYIDRFFASELLGILREKGFSDEINTIAKEAGMISLRSAEVK